MTALIFTDTETTGLALDDDIWEFAAIRRYPDGNEDELHLFVEHDEKRCRTLPELFLSDHLARFPGHGQKSRANAASEIAAFLDRDVDGNRPHIVGAVPNFDTERLAILLDNYGHKPQWHHHLIDVEALAVGYIHGRYEARTVSLPWESDDLSRAVGVDPDRFERHTAMGDARWAREIYDAIAGGSS